MLFQTCFSHTSCFNFTFSWEIHRNITFLGRYSFWGYFRECVTNLVMSLGSKETPIPVFAMVVPGCQTYAAGYLTGAPTSRTTHRKWPYLSLITNPTRIRCSNHHYHKIAQQSFITPIYTLNTDVNSNKL